MCEYIFRVFVALIMSRDLRVICDVTGNAKILVTLKFLALHRQLQ